MRLEKTVDGGLDGGRARLALDAALRDEHDRGLAHEGSRVLQLLRRDERVDVRERDAQQLRDVPLERLQLVFERAPAPAAVEEARETAAQAVGSGAGDEAHLLGRELLDEIA